MVNLVQSALAPTFLFIALRDRGPPTMIGLGAPDQGADQRPNWTVGPSLRLEINLIGVSSTTYSRLLYIILLNTWTNN